MRRRQFLVFLVLSFPGWFLFTITGYSATLTCTKLEPADSMCLLQPTWMGLPGTGEKLTGLEKAWIGTSDCESSSCSYRVMLRMKEGSRPLNPESTGWSSDTRAKEAVADTINRYIDDPRPGELSVRDSYFWGDFIGVWATGLVWVCLTGLLTFKIPRP